MKYSIILILLLCAESLFSQGTFEKNLLLVHSNSIPNGTQFQPLMVFNNQNLQGAFRAGWITNNSWIDSDSLGYASFAVGQDVLASGYYSLSFGFNNKARGDYSFTYGKNNDANGDFSVVGGVRNVANDDYAFIFGKNNTIKATSFNSVSLGSNNSILSSKNMTMGSDNTAFNVNAVAIGYNNSVWGERAIAIGYHLIANQPDEVVLGRYNEVISADILFMLGNGTSDSQRKNAITVNSIGNVGIGKVGDPCQKLTVEKILRHNGKVSCSSDIRFKKDIQNLKIDWATIDNISTVYYKWKDESRNSLKRNRHIGYLAQDFVETYPELIDQDHEGYLQLDYTKTNVIILSGLQDIIETQDQIAAKIDNAARTIHHLSKIKK